MRATILLVMVLGLAACSQTGSGSYSGDYENGDGDYYPGIVAPK